MENNIKILTNKMRIGFIVPSSSDNFDPFRNQPLVTLYLLTILEQHFGEKIELSLIDLRGIEEQHAFRHIPENEVFLYSVTTPDFTELINIMESLRHIYPDSKHIAGGAHTNLFPQHCVKRFDAIVLGEGEDSLINVIDDIFRSNLKKKYKQTKPIDLNLYPYPDRKYLPKSAVVNIDMLQGKYSHLKATEVIFSRGCPFECHFCANKKLKFGPTRYRSPKLITEEIEYLKKEYKIEALVLKDDNSIPLNQKIAKPFLEAIRKAEIKWRGQSRANGVHPEMVKLAFEAGCTHLGVGIESASQEVLKRINKRIDLNEAKNYVNLIHETGIGVRLHFILGLPGEPDDIVKQTLSLIDEMNPNSVILNLLCPMPGSEMFDSPERFGITIDTIGWEKYRSVFGRFDENELPNMTFHYNEITPWGNQMSKDEIVQNYIELQAILRDRGLNY